MELKELQAMDDGQLTTLVREQREALRQLRFGIASKSVKNVREVRTRRLTVARALTLLAQRHAKPARKGSKRSAALAAAAPSAK